MANEQTGRSPWYCDLVMKGGLTSGLVYPQAVLRISDHYRFKNIGGTSAGAIAAAVSAAAALGQRRVDNSGAISGGMARLRTTADELVSEGFIFSLFQPAPKARRLYRFLTGLSAGPGFWSLSTGVAGAIVTNAPIWCGVILAVTLAPAWLLAGWRGVLAALLPSLACALAVGAIAAARRAVVTVRDNFLGLCPGTTQGNANQPGLTNWMHSETRALAGLGEEDGPPVTFGDLADAPRYPGEPGNEALSLQIITTDVSHMEPRTLPFAGGAFWFRKEDFRKLFPAAIVDYMIGLDPAPISHDGATYYRLPDGPLLPIVVAARMSLSFPVLISAIPLYDKNFMVQQPAQTADPLMHGRPSSIAEDTEGLADGGSSDGDAGSAAENDGNAPKPFSMRLCWFTDGGVSSNFPVHMFDAPMPRWPTFGIDLVEPSRNGRPEVFLPVSNNQALRPRYRAVARKSAVGELASFFLGIIGTMQNWRDVLQARAPGYRDRIVQVTVGEGEGGLNLNMPKPVLDRLASKGKTAADLLVNDFDFNNHYWIRYRNLHAAAEEFGIRLRNGIVSPPPQDGVASFTQMSGGGRGGPSYRFTVAQGKEALVRLKTANAEIARWGSLRFDLAKGAPNPRPHLRIVPIF